MASDKLKFQMRQMAENELMTSKAYRDIQESLAKGQEINAGVLTKPMRKRLGLEKAKSFRLTKIGGRSLADSLNKELKRPSNDSNLSESKNRNKLDIKDILHTAIGTFGLPEGVRKVIDGKGKTRQTTVSQPQIFEKIRKDASIPNQEAATNEAVLPEDITVAGGGKAFTSPPVQAGATERGKDSSIPGGGGIVGGFGELVNQLFGKTDSQSEFGQGKLYNEKGHELKLAADQKTLIPVRKEGEKPESTFEELKKRVGKEQVNEFVNTFKQPAKFIESKGGLGAIGEPSRIAQQQRDALEWLKFAQPERYATASPNVLSSGLMGLLQGGQDIQKQALQAAGARTGEQEVVEYMRKTFPDLFGGTVGTKGGTPRPATFGESLKGAGDFKTPFGTFYVNEAGALRKR